MPPAAASLTLSRWADLPPDLLVDVSSRLRDAADFTRFHAVCTPWRDALLSSLRTPRPQFLPWLLTSSKGLILHCTVDFGRVIGSSEISSMSGYRRSREDAILMGPAAGASFVGDGDRNWVSSADGTSAWLFTDTRLLDVLTGAVTRLPKIQEHHDPRLKLPMQNLRGIVYGDGTIFLYGFIYECGMHDFAAAILRPNDAAWTFVNERLDLLGSCGGEPGAAYHNGKVLVFLGVQYWCVLAPPDDSSPGGHCRLESWRCGRPAGHGPREYLRGYCYVLQSHGELLWVSVLVKEDNTDDPARALSLTVHALEEEEVGGGGGGGGRRMGWVARDGRAFVDRILFLGAPSSFVVDDAQLSVNGGCAYFVFRRGLFRYSFVDGEAKLKAATSGKWHRQGVRVAPTPASHCSNR